ncbi:hypothetical protein BGZ91_005623 [Linnemannia elongata]|nr:hypothetical protein BGZ91_005623 [Linnemannia elongata]
MSSTLDDFLNFEFDDEETLDEEELLEAYNHTTRPYSHGLTMDRYTNPGIRQLNYREFARVIANRIRHAYDNNITLKNITLQYTTGENNHIYRTITVDLLSDIDDIEDLLTDDDSFAVFMAGSDKSMALAQQTTYRLNTSYFEVSTQGHSGGSVKTLTMGKFTRLLNTSYGDFDCVFDCISYATKKELPDIAKIRKFLGVKKFARISADLVPKIAQIARTTAAVYEDMVNYEVSESGEIDIKGLKLISGEENAEVKLVLKNNHYYLLISELDMDTQLYELYQLVDSKEIMDPKINRENVIYMFFDYETVNSQQTQQATPYCFSYIIYDTLSNEMVKNVVIRTSDSAEDLEGFYETIRQVFSDVNSNRKGKKYMIGYNNSGFDNFLLVRQAMHSNLPVRDVLVDSEKACDSFHIQNAKLKLKHEEIQDAYYRGKFTEYVRKNEDKIVSYALRDVESLCELFLKVKDVVREQTTTEMHEGLVLEDELTTASMTYKAFKNSLSEEMLELIPILSLDMDKLIRKAVVGGRTQVFWKGEFKGVYHVSIHKQPEDKIIPKRNEKDDTWDWEYDGVIDTYVTQEDIRIMDKFKASYIVIDGYYWKKSSKDVFGAYMGNLMKAMTSVGDITLISGKVEKPKVQVPSIWGVLIYSYARSYMYENFISRSKTKLAMDTDSLFMSEEEYKAFVKDYPELFGDKPGQMKEELGEKKYGIFKGKKFYIIFLLDEDGDNVEIPFKDKDADFHRGSSMCKACKRQADMDRRAERRTGVTDAGLLAMIMKMAAKIDKLEKAVVDMGGELDDDFEEPLKNVENPLKNVERQRKSLKKSELEKTKSKSDIHTDDGDSDKEVVKKPKSKLKSKPNVETREVVKPKKPKMPDSIAEVLRNKSKDKRRK